MNVCASKTGFPRSYWHRLVQPLSACWNGRQGRLGRLAEAIDCVIGSPATRDYPLKVWVAAASGAPVKATQQEVIPNDHYRHVAHLPNGTLSIRIGDTEVTTLESRDGVWVDEDGDVFATIEDCLAYWSRKGLSA